MKTTVFLISIIAGTMMCGCAEVREKTAEELLQNPKMEDEIYSAILDDEKRFLKFIERIMFDENSKSMMMKNSSVVMMVCGSSKMDSLMKHDKKMMENMTNNLVLIVEKDSVVCDKTCAKMIQSDRFKRRMIEHMKDGKMKMHKE